MGAGLALWLEGYPLIGLMLIAFGVGVLWAVGYWVVPWSEPGWYRRTVRALRDWIGSVKAAQEIGRRRAAEIGARVEALPVPNRFVAEAPSVVALFQPDLSSAEPSELDKRLRESAARLEGAAAGVERIETEALAPDERAYAQQLRTALEERLATTARMYEDTGAACGRLASLLAETRAPARRLELQGQLKSAVESYARVMGTARAAAAARDFQTLANLAEQLGPAAAEMQRCRQELRAASPARRAVLDPSGS